MANTFFSLLTPANNSGVLGLSRVSLDGDTLSVDVAASGLTPGQIHPLHLHGFLTDAPERLAVASDDADGDGFVETTEGEATAYGQVLAGLPASGKAGFGLEASPDFPVADALGNLAFSQNYVLDPANPNDAQILERVQARLDGRVVEFHGLDLPGGGGAGTSGEVNGAAGYNPQVPVSQGQLYAVPDLLAPAQDQGPGLDWFGSDPAAFLAKSTALLASLAPYTLNPAGTGPTAPEPPGAATAETDTYAALLQPSNGSGVLGLAAVQIDEANATVTVELWATGLTPGQAHASHIHGFADDRPSLLPNYRLDADRDGFVEDPEGEPVVGPVLLALTDDGSISNAVLPNPVTTADAAGNLRISEYYRFDRADPAQAAIFQELQDRVAGRELQIHGLFVPATEGEGTPGEVNGTAAYKADLPVANGILLPLGEALAPFDLANAGTVAATFLAGSSDAPLI
ncbi:hypothetical protein ACFQS7_29745 [Dankookia sp. GCM10030260]|uniref:hypothetical protein n=1 Tax=Dankookia sp. GCM10030260 TaxID=3273390 RepID=UPI00360E7A77